tara:strand:+ start:5677 stop:6678 length:1002 start_codon:yes stop_codon:yes gene_type:complete
MEKGNIENSDAQNLIDSEPKIDNNPDKKIDLSKYTKNPWMISTIVLGIIALILLIMVFNGGVTGNVISSSEAGERIIEFAASQGAEADLVEVNDKSGFYEVVLSIQGQEVPLYVTKDGEYFTQALVPLTGQVTAPTQQPPVDVPKSDKPIVELFVMTHCPYGTQAEKGMLPVYSLLGDKIDSSIKFVHYFLHEGPKQEPYETPIQVCIREEQGSKYNEYLTCYLEDGDSDRCLTETGINKAQLDTCKAGKADEYYDADSTLSEGYGVRGSPSLVINGEMVQSGRSPAAYLSAICSAFTDGTAPEECDEDLNSASPSPGFGYTASAGGSTNAQC